MIFADRPRVPDPLRARIHAHTRRDEAACVEAFLDDAVLSPGEREDVAERARRLVVAVREAVPGSSGIDAFLHSYGLSTQEGVVLMCLAEALLRIPDSETANRLIRDKLASADWQSHLGASSSLLVNASTWGLMLTGRLMALDPAIVEDLGDFLGRLVARSGEPVIREALRQAMHILASQFVLGRTIEEALERAAPNEAEGVRYSFDMLGEAACTRADAQRYAEAYRAAIAAVGRRAGEPRDGADVFARPSVSVKLSALHPRFEFAQSARLMDELVPLLHALAREARDNRIGLTIDAEEADRLDVTLDVFEAVFADRALDGWEGLGLVVQAYQKRGLAVIDWLAAVARAHRRRIPVRLVKGAYWDSEIKRCQERGLDGYPVFTRKAATDLSYLACARRLLAAPDAFHAQFATHNAHTFAAAVVLAGKAREFEFQRLHGMGEALYRAALGDDERSLPCRVYAPVGSHEDLLPYLVRRLLENGANTSFVNRIVDLNAPIESLIADPAERWQSYTEKRHPSIPLPAHLYCPERRNARGIDLNDPASLAALAEAMDDATRTAWRAAPLVAGAALAGVARPVLDPADHRRVVGEVVEADQSAVEAALERAVVAAPAWERTPADERAAILERAADLFEANMATLMAMAVREAGKTIPDAMAEIREAVDFCRYYAVGARAEFASPQRLPGPTGEVNEVALRGRGVFVCISPWNFPLAIFAGQVTAALAAGNAVIAKPAEQTPLIAAQAVRLLHQAGVPVDALALLPGRGETVGAALVADARTTGVAMTGSTDTARAINQALAHRDGPIAPLIAETGGQNAMIVDSSALPEQVVGDAVHSAFNSAGQRCSALRVLFVQHEIAEKLIAMLTGAMAELAVGDPSLLAVDVGPVIDAEARDGLEAHAQRMASEGRLVHAVALPAGLEHGTFVAPRAFEIDSLDRLEREVFGPMLHLVRYRAGELDAVLQSINRTGYGLTLGIHSRIDATARYIRERTRIGNVYVNRNMIGAVVGVQPFGGEGLSGTGPKAGGPRYLARFATERSLSVNIAAMGGNPGLLSLDEQPG